MPFTRTWGCAMVLDVTAWATTCYGRLTFITRHNDLDAVKRWHEVHIHICRYGHMSWASSITWHPSSGGVWVSAAGGEYLDHAIRPVIDVTLDHLDPGR